MPKDPQPADRRHPTYDPELRHDETLAFINQYIADKSFPPSRREIMTGLGLKNPSSAQSRIDELVARGAIVVTPGIPRGIRVMKTETEDL